MSRPLRRSDLGGTARLSYDAQKTAAITDAGSALASAKTKASQQSEKVAAIEFMNLCDRAMLPRPVTQFRFHPARLWRFDFAWESYRLALEIDGGVFIAGRHNSGVGFKGDMEKYNSATVLGWAMLRCTPSDLLKPETVDLVRRVLRTRRRFPSSCS